MSFILTDNHNKITSDHYQLSFRFRPMFKERNTVPFPQITLPSGTGWMFFQKGTTPDSQSNSMGHLREKIY